MNLASRLFCRTFQTCFHLALPILPYREPHVFERLDSIIDLLQNNNITSVLLVTDPVLRNTGKTVLLEELLADQNIRCAVYDQVCPNPTVANVEQARALYGQEHCQCLIAFGGGSSIDCAKAVGAQVVYPEKTLGQLQGLLHVVRKIPPLIAIPTTAGTGSEVTLTAVITDSACKHKYTMNDFTLIPTYAVLDPEVTYSLPPHLTATTGMDALTHAVEAYIGRSTSRETRTLALEAVALIFQNIEVAYADPTNREARENMLTASYKAGIAFSKSYVGYVHAVAHSLGGQYNVPHGFANAVLLPIVLEDYGSCVHKKLHQLGMAAGVTDESDDPAEGARKFITAIRHLNRRMDIPTVIRGIREEDIPVMANHAATEANPLYPVPKLMGEQELRKFYYKVADWS